MMRNVRFIIIMLVVGLTACSESDDVQGTAPELKSSTPENNAVDVDISTEIELVFDEAISLASDHGITVNDVVADVEVSDAKLIFTADLVDDKEYKILIPKGAIVNSANVSLAKEIQLSFTTKGVDNAATSPMNFVANMGVGWNLGNTLDTKDANETAWGNPKATKELIDAIRAKGFKTLRVPITWQYHMGDAPDYTIEKDWLDRVEEVANYGLDNDMYVILNIHHDEEWLVPTYAEVDRVKVQLDKVWTQIANRFKAYDEHLIFETLNETRLKGSAEEWSGGTAEGRDCINQFHKVAVEAIRETGSKNTKRYIMLSTYAASSSLVAIDGLVLPSASNLIVSVHNYFPYKFALAENNFDTQWGTDDEKQALDAELDRVVNKFINNGIPVVMGEWGSLNRNNLEDRKQHATYYAKACIDRGICPIWWDNGNTNEFGIINRANNQWAFSEIADVIVSASK